MPLIIKSQTSELPKIAEKHTVTNIKTNVRLSDVPAGTFVTITSRKAFKKAIKANLVLLNDIPAFTADYINLGDVITILKSNKRSSKPTIDLDIDILYEDDYLAVINKPAGIEVSGNKKFTIENALPSLLKKSSQPDGFDRPLPAHRLDYPTSGCLLIGKTSETLIALHRLFQEKQILKTYLAVTIGMQNKGNAEKISEGVINEPIDGKASTSTYKILKTIASKKYGALNLVELHPHTGRRHQLRKHMAHIGTPIFGEKIYGNLDFQGKGQGLYLQALNLNFQHPKTNEQINISSKIAKKFSRLFPLEN